MRVHFIAIGGAIMHQLALDLQKNGYTVSGSDDVIQEPSLSRLKNAGLLPKEIGFNELNVTSDIDAVILGMHAKFDNPELTKAMEMGLKVYSFPEYIYEHSKDKKRVVIAGSHGKTSITSMIMHTLRYHHMDFDYLVGSNVQGFDQSVRVTKEAPIIIIEGDEYLASCLNKEPKFIFYKANLALLSGIEWDHINVFPTEAIYDHQFEKLIDSLASNATVIYHNEPKIKALVEPLRSDVEKIAYDCAPYELLDDQIGITYQGKTYTFEIFGNHNFQNLEGAQKICSSLGIDKASFYEAMQEFKGAGRRLEKIVDSTDRIVYKDFAHSPSKLKATVDAVRERYPNQYIVACFELHTFSSLNQDFLNQYKNSISNVEKIVLFIDQEVVRTKGHQTFSKESLANAFRLNEFEYFTNKESLKNYLDTLVPNHPLYLMMSSGTFGGMELSQIGIVPKTESSILTIEERLHRMEDKEHTKKEMILIQNCKSLINILILTYILFFIPSLYTYLKAKDKEIKKQAAFIFNFSLLTSIFIVIGCGCMIYNQNFIGFTIVGISLYYHFMTIHRNIKMLAKEGSFIIVPLIKIL